MADGYCVKCKARKQIANGIEEIMKNGRRAIKGVCPTCGTVMFKILGGKAAMAASAEAGGSSASPASAEGPASCGAAGPSEPTAQS